MRYIIAFAVLRSIPWALQVSEFANCMVVVSVESDLSLCDNNSGTN
jgi:hypothetical protein